VKNRVSKLEDEMANGLYWRPQLKMLFPEMKRIRYVDISIILRYGLAIVIIVIFSDSPLSLREIQN
jgi:hypothetical protein